MTRLPEVEYRVLAALEPGRSLVLAELAAASRVDQSLLTAGAVALSQRGLVAIAEQSQHELSLTEDGQRAAAGGLPERAALAAIRSAGGTVAFAGLPGLTGRPDTRAEVKWLTKKGWCSRDATTLTLTDHGRAAADVKGADEVLVEKLAGGPMTEAELAAAGVDVRSALELLRGRDELLRRRRRTSRLLSLTDAGAALKAGGIEPAQEVTQLTPELIATGRWRDVIIKRYDVTLATGRQYPGKAHPLQRVIQETRRAFLEMGFEETASPVVETAFWDFDALFQPQDHPAREMQDTFYLAVPAAGRLPDAELVRRVARTHEDGGDTGSTGWRYRWDAATARKLVLRTHTTAATIRAVAQNPGPPRKVFSVGKVFRRENVDQTHLPEFIQIDGIIIDEGASLATLFGTLSEFYLRMGAKEVRFRPSFFPYTEPSAEAFAFIEGLGWVEMCGCGVFRPEVTRPLGCRTPVIAWGGGLERVAMLRFGLDDIRKLYWADINWLRETKLCR
ncbi:phenylalanine--tRNA ligase subunit alpha [candidate division WOR-3 bacterium]|nr:phenylalanine--tRNA ligase subunit alpha [candidate division WOR-3 bacterium]